MNDIDLVYEKKDFRLGDGIPFPLDSLHRQVDGHHVFLSVDKASYVVTDDIGAHFVELLLDEMALGEAIERVCGDFSISTGAASKTLSQLLIQAEKNGYYQHRATVEDSFDHFPILCYLSRFCNLACTHCYMAAGPTISTENDLSVAEWSEVFAGYRSFLSTHEQHAAKITLTGGEPMARRDFFEVAQAAKSHDVFVEVFSNGTLIRDAATARRLAEVADLVQISLDGATAPINDAIRGKGTHRRIVRALEHLMATDVHVRLAVTLMPANAQDFAENLIDTVRRIGQGKIEIRIGLANIQGRADSSVRFADSVEGEKILQSLLGQLYEQGLRPPRNIQSNFRDVSCGYGKSLNIGCDGTVYACAIEVFPIGNLREQSFESLASRVYQLAFDSEVDNIRGCQKCELRYFCNGGCRLNNLFKHDNLFITACNRAKKQELLRKLVQRELTEDPAAAAARVGSFWLAS